MHTLTFRKELPALSTIVVKIGSRILTAAGSDVRIPRLIRDIIAIHTSGIRVIVVSSGAIATGMQALSLETRPESIPMQQACASIGQHRLMQMYEGHFSKANIRIGQVLLTWDDLRSKKRYLNLRNTLFQLIGCNAIPIVNENDSVGIEEIQFGNNDMLGAQVALLVNADLFINLTDVDGLFDRNPQTDSNAVHIPLVTSMSSSLRKFADDKKKEISVGGMSTKLKAAEIISRAGIHSLIGNGFSQPLSEVVANPAAATLFIPHPKKMSSRHRWIAFTGQSNGEVVIDEGASTALVKKGKSLLPAGIHSVKGTFKQGDMVEIRTQKGDIIARGLVNYSETEIRSIMNCRSSEIATRLGDKRFDEVIHRDNLVIL